MWDAVISMEIIPHLRLSFRSRRLLFLHAALSACLRLRQGMQGNTSLAAEISTEPFVANADGPTEGSDSSVHAVAWALHGKVGSLVWRSSDHQILIGQFEVPVRCVFLRYRPSTPTAPKDLDDFNPPPTFAKRLLTHHGMES